MEDALTKIRNDADKTKTHEETAIHHRRERQARGCLARFEHLRKTTWSDLDELSCVIAYEEAKREEPNYLPYHEAMKEIEKMRAAKHQNSPKRK